jgi:flagellar protein FlgJ
MGVGGVNSSPSGVTSINSSTAGIEKNSSSDASFEQTLKSSFDNNNPKELKKACQDFEGIILNMMFSEMRATIQKSELIPSDAGTDIFQSMMDEELTKATSKGRGIGIADMLYKQLSKRLPKEETTDTTENAAIKD